MSHHDTDWMMSAFCAQIDPQLWTSDRGVTRAVAKTLCTTRCKVLAECRDYAITSPQVVRFGVIGGMYAAERARLRKEHEESTAMAHAQAH
jgi:Transcription factor WhiB